jgi:hypothetical protein
MATLANNAATVQAGNTTNPPAGGPANVLSASPISYDAYCQSQVHLAVGLSTTTDLFATTKPRPGQVSS